MTSPKVIPFPKDRVSISKSPAESTTETAEIIIFPGERWERLPPKLTIKAIASGHKSQRSLRTDRS